ncbi:hypothetical protein NQ318_016250 [Aromia moschata]|uniref:Partial AB-hydrolase lipase domain-containing protein n=1 Tax=Aromia moschata TaxID=1265417 RepID=A0AAV8XYQ6_9CUCU|nr:hypothetical protein NQ318_016250 [Aromia moschata]
MMRGRTSGYNHIISIHVDEHTNNTDYWWERSEHRKHSKQPELSAQIVNRKCFLFFDLPPRGMGITKIKLNGTARAGNAMPATPMPATSKCRPLHYRIALYSLIAKRNGYPLEKYKVTTDDGYILALFRIPHNNTDPNSKRQPVLLQHGIGARAIFLDADGGKLVRFTFGKFTLSEIDSNIEHLNNFDFFEHLLINKLY